MLGKLSSILQRNLFKNTANKFNMTKGQLSRKMTLTANPQVGNGTNMFSRFRQHLMVDCNGGKRIVGYWLVGSSAMVFGLIVFGGLTRLTESGLSMVDWKLVHFSPPKNQQEWQEYFEKYQQFPEFQINNRNMSLEEFKRIYYMEHIHRVYGRVIGLAIILPSIFFSLKGWVSPRNKKFLTASSALVVFQGLLGWYMVKSGLSEDIVKNREEPRVSPYRLTAHLGSAFVLYGLLLNTAINILSPKMTGQNGSIMALKAFKRHSHSLASLVFLTALSGAFVAGLDAGMIYNTFPMMGDRIIPSDIWIEKLGWRNPFENPTCAQFNHRILAISSISAISALWLYSRRLPLPRNIRLLTNALMGVAWAQGTLGVLTLLNSVPISLASAHQAGSVSVLTFALWLVNRLHALPK